MLQIFLDKRHIKRLRDMDGDVLAAPVRMALWRDVLLLAAFFRDGSADCPPMSTKEALFSAHDIFVRKYTVMVDTMTAEMEKIRDEYRRYPPLADLESRCLGELKGRGWRTPVLAELWDDEETEFTAHQLEARADEMEPRRPDYRKTGYI